MTQTNSMVMFSVNEDMPSDVTSIEQQTQTVI